MKGHTNSPFILFKIPLFTTLDNLDALTEFRGEYMGRVSQTC